MNMANDNTRHPSTGDASHLQRLRVASCPTVVERDASTRALWQTQDGHTLAVNGPLLFLRAGVRDGVPHGVNLTVRRARALADALIAGAEMLEQMMPARCGCGEPIEADESACVECTTAIVLARRTKIRALA